MKQSLGCFSKEKLEELAAQPNVTVMQTTHDIVFEPWAAVKVMNCCDKIVRLAKTNASRQTMRDEDSEIEEFASKYTVLFDKVSDREFVADDKNIDIIRNLVMLRAMVENGVLSEEEAKSRCSDIALKGLIEKVKEQKGENKE